MGNFSWAPAVVAVFAASLVAREAAFQRASRRGNVIVFPPGIGLKALLLFGTPFFVYVGLQIIKEGTDKWLGLICIGLAVASFVYLPGTILIDSTSIRETRWFGLKRTCIPWSEVEFAGNDIENSVTVRSNDDRVIKHTRYHADRPAFIEALKRYYPDCTFNQPTYKPWVPLGAP
jgi:hypothetical protein